MRALIVDDSRAIRLVLKKHLVSAGFDTFLEAGDGVEALERLHQASAVDLVLVDWNMPRMNGLEFVIAVRSKPEFKRVRLMMVTTEAETERVVSAIEAGADEYLMKPFTADALRSKLGMLGLAQ